jgi:hypothetical protein
MNSDPRLVRIIFPAVGAAVLVGAIALAIDTQHFISSASKTEGKVVKRDYKTHIEFMPQQGKPAQFSTSSFQSYMLGDRVPVLYTPDPISGFRTAIDTPIDLWGTSILFSLMGITFIWVGRNTDKIPGWRRNLK